MKQITITRKKFISLLAGSALVLGLLAGCSSSASTAASDETGSAAEEGFEPQVIKVAASPTPHAEILNDVVAPLLAEQGYELQVTEFTDYVLPNTATEEGEVDANYFQHQPYLDSFNEENGTHLVSVCAVHFEPFGIYAGKTASLDELGEGASVAVPNDTTNEARALLLLEQEGLISVDKNAGITATINDIVDNPLNLEFYEVEAAAVPTVLADVDIACINGNYALEAGLSVAGDALAVEANDSLAAETYANVLVVEEGNENTEATQALIAALTSEEVRDYVDSTYEGAVLTVF